MSTEKQQQTSSVLDLMSNGLSVDNIRKQILIALGVSANDNLTTRLTIILNGWLRTQDPKDHQHQLSLKEKKAIVEFVEFLEKASQCQLMRNGEPCRFDMTVDSKQPEGSFRVRAIGANYGIRRVRLSELIDDAPFEFQERKQEAGAAQTEAAWANQPHIAKSRKSKKTELE